MNIERYKIDPKECNLDDDDICHINMQKDILFNKIKKNHPNINIETVFNAFCIANFYHRNQKRSSGEPYIIHPIAVADILLYLKLDTGSIVTALLHDVVEDTSMTIKDVRNIFGDNIGLLVDGVTKLAKIQYRSEHTKQAENFRKLLVAISKDIRVLLVKLADRIHNMQTLNHISSKEKRERIAQETIDIYAPLAERIGIHKFKGDLQDLAFRSLHPEIYNFITSRLEFLKDGEISIIETTISTIDKKLKSLDMSAKVTGREKNPYSIWKKMEHKSISFDQLSDIIAFRIIVQNISDCYKVLGIINTSYHMIPGSFKDYISTPKKNGYQSIHTVVIGPNQKCIEIQIRTNEMHQIAEYGVASHCLYKQNIYEPKERKAIQWIQQLLDILETTHSPEEFLEHSKVEMYYDQVFCFTKEGDLIAIPQNSSVLDFAFAIDIDIGLRAISSNVNGINVPISTKLKNGDQVEIIYGDVPKPSLSWYKFVVTGRARSNIKKFILG